MASDYVNAFMRLADSRIRRAEPSLESSLRSFQSAWPADDELRGLADREFQKF
jgi:hypothetical protein